MNASSSDWSGRGRAAVLAGWFVAVSIPLAPLALQHVVPLGRATAASAVPVPGVSVRHVLSTDCRCSRAVAGHLIARGARSGEVEEVWLVGADATLARRLHTAGFRVRSATAADVRRELGPAGSPFLIVYAPNSRELYAGGYAPKRPREPGDVQDISIVAALRHGRTVDPYPAYGCLGRDEAELPARTF